MTSFQHPTHAKDTPGQKPIRVYLVDDHQIFLDGLKSLIEKEKDILFMGENTDGKRALQEIRHLKDQIDVVVLDVSMPDSEIDGIHLCKHVKEDCPNIKVLALTMHADTKYINALLRADTDGYILKNKGKEEMVQAVRTLASDPGEKYYGKEITKKAMALIQGRFTDNSFAGESKLTSREIEVVSLVGKGLKSSEIAEKLHISKKTVETHKINIRDKLDLRDVKQLLIFARENGYAID